MEIKRIAVLGLGIMGHGIAQVAAQSGLQVSAYDINEKAIENGMDAIKSSLARLVKKEKLSQAEAGDATSRISTYSDLIRGVENAEVIIEAIPEVLELKKETFKKIASSLKPDAIIATNTSQFSITDLASASERPDRVIGMHWFNPPQIMRLIELVRGLETTDHTLEVIQDLCASFGKETIICKKDVSLPLKMWTRQRNWPSTILWAPWNWRIFQVWIRHIGRPRPWKPLMGNVTVRPIPCIIWFSQVIWVVRPNEGGIVTNKSNEICLGFETKHDSRF